MTAEIGVVFQNGNDHIWLPRLREWMTTNGPSFARLGVKAPVQPRGSLDEALSWHAELPFERLLVTVGYTSHDIQGCQYFGAFAGEPIIVSDPHKREFAGAASASFVNGPAIVPCREVLPQLRKSLIRVGLRGRVQIRPPSSDEELERYFSLRYEVYQAIGFLGKANRAARLQWEIDYWDRTAVPLCAITKDGQVIGCARLIRTYGDEEQPYVSKIQRLLDERGDATLQELFRFPKVPLQPFDVLMEFCGFRTRFRDLIHTGKKAAEIGRVAVHPDHRGQFLSEALVDTAVSFAQIKNVSSIFLACRNELEPLYEKCGFRAVPGVTSDKFLNIALPSIVMEKQI
jgi:predicted GNAT family N-acyltransferase